MHGVVLSASARPQVGMFWRNQEPWTWNCNSDATPTQQIEKEVQEFLVSIAIDKGPPRSAGEDNGSTANLADGKKKKGPHLTVKLVYTENMDYIGEIPHLSLITACPPAPWNWSRTLFVQTCCRPWMKTQMNSPHRYAEISEYSLNIYKILFRKHVLSIIGFR